MLPNYIEELLLNLKAYDGEIKIAYDRNNIPYEITATKGKAQYVIQLLAAEAAAVHTRALVAEELT